MPDLSPSLDTLRKLGLSVPPSSKVPSKEEQELSDMLARASQANDPNWKKAARLGIGALVGAAKGAVGTDPSEDVRQRIISGTATPDEKAEWYSSGATQMGQGIADAGLPFAAYKAHDVSQVFHGSPKVFEKFDPKKYDTADVLGWLTHFAEDPEYADTYAQGFKNYGEHANIRAATPQAQNVLDLVKPNIDDLSQVIASFPKNDPRRISLINKFKDVRKRPEYYRNDISQTHYPELSKIPTDEIPMFHLSENLRLNPGDLEKTPFDAIRYNDVTKKSWAVPETTPITTPWGIPMNNSPRNLTVTRLPDDFPTKSELTVRKTLGKLNTGYESPTGLKIGDEYNIITPFGNKISGPINSNSDLFEIEHLLKSGGKIYQPITEFKSNAGQTADYVNKLKKGLGLSHEDAATLVDHSSFNDIEDILKGDFPKYLDKHPHFAGILNPDVTGVIPEKSDWYNPSDYGVTKSQQLKTDYSSPGVDELFKNDNINWQQSLHDKYSNQALADSLKEGDKLTIVGPKTGTKIDVNVTSKYHGVNDFTPQEIKDHFDKGWKIYEGEHTDINNQPDVHNLGNAEAYENYFTPEKTNPYAPWFPSKPMPLDANMDYSPAQMTHILNKADELGIDYSKMPDYPTVDAAITDAKKKIAFQHVKNHVGHLVDDNAIQSMINMSDSSVIDNLYNESKSINPPSK